MDDDEEEFDFKEERSAGERTEKRTYVDLDYDVEKDIRQKTPIEIFVDSVRKIANIIIDNNYVDKKIFNSNDLDIILKNIYLFNKPEYKNPTCFILGYIATDGGRSISKEKLFKMYRLIDEIDSSTNIQPPDIIRYSTLWINTVLNK